MNIEQVLVVRAYHLSTAFRQYCKHLSVTVELYKFFVITEKNNFVVYIILSVKIDGFRQAFVTSASWDRDELI